MPLARPLSEGLGSTELDRQKEALVLRPNRAEADRGSKFGDYSLVSVGYRRQEIAMQQVTDAHPAVGSDPDLVEQAKPGHGVPSQDPNSSAQLAIGPEQAIAEQKSVFVGAGVMAGAAAGAVVGTAVAGPVGVIVGATIGAAVGALGGAAAGSLSQGSKVGEPK